MYGTGKITVRVALNMDRLPLTSGETVWLQSRTALQLSHPGHHVKYVAIGSLSSDVFERCTSTGSEVFSLLTYLDDIKFVFLSFFTVIEAI